MTVTCKAFMSNTNVMQCPYMQCTSSHAYSLGSISLNYFVFFLSYFCALQTIQTSKKDLEKHLQANSLKYMIKCSPEIGKKGSSDEIRAKYGILILSSFSTRQASA